MRMKIINPLEMDILLFFLAIYCMPHMPDFSKTKENSKFFLNIFDISLLTEFNP